MAGISGEEVVYKRESRLGMTTFTYRSRRYTFPSVIVKGDLGQDKGVCIMLDIGLFCPFCTGNFKAKFVSSQSRLAIYKSNANSKGGQSIKKDCKHDDPTCDKTQKQPEVVEGKETVTTTNGKQITDDSHENVGDDKREIDRESQKSVKCEKEEALRHKLHLVDIIAITETQATAEVKESKQIDIADKTVLEVKAIGDISDVTETLLRQEVEETVIDSGTNMVEITNDDTYVESILSHPQDVLILELNACQSQQEDVNTLETKSSQTVKKTDSIERYVEEICSTAINDALDDMKERKADEETIKCEMSLINIENNSITSELIASENENSRMVENQVEEENDEICIIEPDRKSEEDSMSLLISNEVTCERSEKSQIIEKELKKVKNITQESVSITESLRRNESMEMDIKQSDIVEKEDLISPVTNNEITCESDEKSQIIKKELKTERIVTQESIAVNEGVRKNEAMEVDNIKQSGNGEKVDLINPVSSNQITCEGEKTQISNDSIEGDIKNEKMEIDGKQINSVEKEDPINLGTSKEITRESEKSQIIEKKLETEKDATQEGDAIIEGDIKNEKMEIDGKPSDTLKIEDSINLVTSKEIVCESEKSQLIEKELNSAAQESDVIIEGDLRNDAMEIVVNQEGTNENIGIVDSKESALLINYHFIGEYGDFGNEQLEFVEELIDENMAFFYTDVIEESNVFYNQVSTEITNLILSKEVGQSKKLRNDIDTTVVDKQLKTTENNYVKKDTDEENKDANGFTNVDIKPQQLKFKTSEKRDLKEHSQELGLQDSGYKSLIKDINEGDDSNIDNVSQSKKQNGNDSTMSDPDDNEDLLKFFAGQFCESVVTAAEEAAKLIKEKSKFQQPVTLSNSDVLDPSIAKIVKGLQDEISGKEKEEKHITEMANTALQSSLSHTVPEQNETTNYEIALAEQESEPSNSENDLSMVSSTEQIIIEMNIDKREFVQENEEPELQSKTLEYKTEIQHTTTDQRQNEGVDDKKNITLEEQETLYGAVENKNVMNDKEIDESIITKKISQSVESATKDFKCDITNIDSSNKEKEHDIIEAKDDASKEDTKPSIILSNAMSRSADAVMLRHEFENNSNAIRNMQRANDRSNLVRHSALSRSAEAALHDVQVLIDMVDSGDFSTVDSTFPPSSEFKCKKPETKHASLQRRKASTHAPANKRYSDYTSYSLPKEDKSDDIQDIEIGKGDFNYDAEILSGSPRARARAMDRLVEDLSNLEERLSKLYRDTLDEDERFTQGQPISTEINETINSNIQSKENTLRSEQNVQQTESDNQAQMDSESEDVNSKVVFIVGSSTEDMKSSSENMIHRDKTETSEYNKDVSPESKVSSNSEGYPYQELSEEDVYQLKAIEHEEQERERLLSSGASSDNEDKTTVSDIDRHIHDAVIRALEGVVDSEDVMDVNSSSSSEDEGVEVCDPEVAVDEILENVDVESYSPNITLSKIFTQPKSKKNKRPKLPEAFIVNANQTKSLEKHETNAETSTTEAENSVLKEIKFSVQESKIDEVLLTSETVVESEVTNDFKTDDFNFAIEPDKKDTATEAPTLIEMKTENTLPSVEQKLISCAENTKLEKHDITHLDKEASPEAIFERIVEAISGEENDFLSEVEIEQHRLKREQVISQLDIDYSSLQFAQTRLTQSRSSSCEVIPDDNSSFDREKSISTNVSEASIEDQSEKSETSNVGDQSENFIDNIIEETTELTEKILSAYCEDDASLAFEKMIENEDADSEEKTFEHDIQFKIKSSEVVDTEYEIDVTCKSENIAQDIDPSVVVTDDIEMVEIEQYDSCTQTEDSECDISEILASAVEENVPDILVYSSLLKELSPIPEEQQDRMPMAQEDIDHELTIDTEHDYLQEPFYESSISSPHSPEIRQSLIDSESDISNYSDDKQGIEPQESDVSSLGITDDKPSKETFDSINRLIQSSETYQGHFYKACTQLEQYDNDQQLSPNEKELSSHIPDEISDDTVATVIQNSKDRNIISKEEIMLARLELQPVSPDKEITLFGDQLSIEERDLSEVILDKTQENDKKEKVSEESSDYLSEPVRPLLGNRGNSNLLQDYKYDESCPHPTGTVSIVDIVETYEVSNIMNQVEGFDEMVSRNIVELEDSSKENNSDVSCEEMKQTGKETGRVDCEKLVNIEETVQQTGSNFFRKNEEKEITVEASSMTQETIHQEENLVYMHRIDQEIKECGEANNLQNGQSNLLMQNEQTNKQDVSIHNICNTDSILDKATTENTSNFDGANADQRLNETENVGEDTPHGKQSLEGDIEIKGFSTKKNSKEHDVTKLEAIMIDTKLISEKRDFTGSSARQMDSEDKIHEVIDPIKLKTNSECKIDYDVKDGHEKESNTTDTCENTRFNNKENTEPDTKNIHKKGDENGDEQVESTSRKLINDSDIQDSLGENYGSMHETHFCTAAKDKKNEAEKIDWSHLVSDASTNVAHFETEKVLSKGQAEDFLRHIFMSHQKHELIECAGESSDHEQSIVDLAACLSDVKTATPESDSDSGEVIHEERLSQEISLVFLWRGKKGESVYKDKEPYRELHLKRITRIKDFDIEVVEGPLIEQIKDQQEENEGEAFGKDLKNEEYSASNMSNDFTAECNISDNSSDSELTIGDILERFSNASSDFHMSGEVQPYHCIGLHGDSQRSLSMKAQYNSVLVHISKMADITSKEFQTISVKACQMHEFEDTMKGLLGLVNVPAGRKHVPHRIVYDETELRRVPGNTEDVSSVSTAEAQQINPPVLRRVLVYEIDREIDEDDEDELSDDVFLDNEDDLLNIIKKLKVEDYLTKAHTLSTSSNGDISNTKDDFKQSEQQSYDNYFKYLVDSILKEVYNQINQQNSSVQDIDESYVNVEKGLNIHTEDMRGHFDDIREYATSITESIMTSALETAVSNQTLNEQARLSVNCPAENILDIQREAFDLKNGMEVGDGTHTMLLNSLTEYSVETSVQVCQQVSDILSGHVTNIDEPIVMSMLVVYSEVLLESCSQIPVHVTGNTEITLFCPLEKTLVFDSESEQQICTNVRDTDIVQIGRSRFIKKPHQESFHVEVIVYNCHLEIQVYQTEVCDIIKPVVDNTATTSEHPSISVAVNYMNQLVIGSVEENDVEQDFDLVWDVQIINYTVEGESPSTSPEPDIKRIIYAKLPDDFKDIRKTKKTEHNESVEDKLEVAYIDSDIMNGVPAKETNEESVDDNMEAAYIDSDMMDSGPAKKTRNESVEDKQETVYLHSDIMDGVPAKETKNIFKQHEVKLKTSSYKADIIYTQQEWLLSKTGCIFRRTESGQMHGENIILNNDILEHQTRSVSTPSLSLSDHLDCTKEAKKFTPVIGRKKAVIKTRSCGDIMAGDHDKHPPDKGEKTDEGMEKTKSSSALALDLTSSPDEIKSTTSIEQCNIPRPCLEKKKMLEDPESVISDSIANTTLQKYLFVQDKKTPSKERKESVNGSLPLTYTSDGVDYTETVLFGPLSQQYYNEETLQVVSTPTLIYSSSGKEGNFDDTVDSSKKGDYVDIQTSSESDLTMKDFKILYPSPAPSKEATDFGIEGDMQKEIDLFREEAMQMMGKCEKEEKVLNEREILDIAGVSEGSNVILQKISEHSSYKSVSERKTKSQVVTDGISTRNTSGVKVKEELIKEKHGSVENIRQTKRETEYERLKIDGKEIKFKQRTIKEVNTDDIEDSDECNSPQEQDVSIDSANIAGIAMKQKSPDIIQETVYINEENKRTNDNINSEGDPPSRIPDLVESNQAFHNMLQDKETLFHSEDSSPQSYKELNDFGNSENQKEDGLNGETLICIDEITTSPVENIVRPLRIIENITCTEVEKPEVTFTAVDQKDEPTINLVIDCQEMPVWNRDRQPEKGFSSPINSSEDSSGDDIKNLKPYLSELLLHERKYVRPMTKEVHKIGVIKKERKANPIRKQRAAEIQALVDEQELMFQKLRRMRKECDEIIHDVNTVRKEFHARQQRRASSNLEELSREHEPIRSLPRSRSFSSDMLYSAPDEDWLGQCITPLSDSSYSGFDSSEGYHTRSSWGEDDTALVPWFSDSFRPQQGNVADVGSTTSAQNLRRLDGGVDPTADLFTYPLSSTSLSTPVITPCISHKRRLYSRTRDRNPDNFKAFSSPCLSPPCDRRTSRQPGGECDPDLLGLDPQREGRESGYYERSTERVGAYSRQSSYDNVPTQAGSEGSLTGDNYKEANIKSDQELSKSTEGNKAMDESSNG